MTSFFSRRLHADLEQSAKQRDDIQRWQEDIEERLEALDADAHVAQRERPVYGRRESDYLK